MPPDPAVSDLVADLVGKAFRSAPCGLALTDRAGTIRVANDALLAWTERPEGELLGRARFADLLTPAGRIYAETHLLPMLLVRGGFEEVALTLRSPAGLERHVLVSARRDEGEGGAAATFCLYPAEQRLAYERELAAMRRAAQTRVSWLRQVETMAGIGAWSLDAETRALTWSDQVFHLHGLAVAAPPSLEEALAFYAPEDREGIAARFETALVRGGSLDYEAGLVTAQGALRRVRALGEAEEEGGRVRRVAGVIQDVTDRHEAEQRLWRAAHVDDLSDLANRAWFWDRLGQAMEAAAKAGAEGGPALLVLDLDHFKEVNDALGHQAGDAVIRAVADRMRDCGGDAFLARLGGDEFAALIEGPDAGGRAVTLAGRLRAASRRPIPCGGEERVVPISIGLAQAPADATTGEALFQRADMALYADKRRGGDRRSGSGRPGVLSGSVAR